MLGYEEGKLVAQNKFTNSVAVSTSSNPTSSILGILKFHFPKIQT